MTTIAYLFNRYPEATLTTIRREVLAVADTGITVYRFAHRPSLQPLADAMDAAEAGRTTYLAESAPLPLLLSVFRMVFRHPIRFGAALIRTARLRPTSFRHLGYLAMACRLVTDLHAARAEVLHAHFGQNAAAVAMLAHVLGGPPWSLTVHGPEDIDPAWLPQLAARVRDAKVTVAISRLSAAAVRTVAPDGADVRVLGMGVNGSFLSPPISVPEPSRFVCISRFVERKGHIVLIEAMRCLKSRGIAGFCRLIGDGPLKDRLVSEIEQRELSDRFEFCGWQSEPSIGSSLDAASFLVLPSYSEGVPVSIMEAFARGRPVVASAVGAVGELVRDGVNGLLVAPGQPAQLADAMAKLLSRSAEELFAMGLRGREEVEARHDARKNAAVLTGIWREILQ